MAIDVARIPGDLAILVIHVLEQGDDRVVEFVAQLGAYLSTIFGTR